MEIRTLTSPEDLAAYDVWVKNHPEGSLWQSLEWKKYQESLGREVRIYAEEDGGRRTGDRGHPSSAVLRPLSFVTTALVVIDRTAFGFSTWDIPRGPLGAISGERSAVSTLIDEIAVLAKGKKCMSIYFSPATPLCALRSALCASARHEQPEATRIIDLRLSEEKILSQMRQKGRYNIRVAEKNGVYVEHSGDIDAFYTLAKATSERDGFRCLPKDHYEKFLNDLPGAFLLLAYTGIRVNEQTSKRATTPVAALLGITWPAHQSSQSGGGNKQGIYYYGASSYEHRALMAPYALQWAAMRHCKTSGCLTYDLLGVSPPLNGAGESGHSWTGISDFKAKFGGRVLEYPKEQKIVLRPILKGLLGIKRRLVG